MKEAKWTSSYWRIGGKWKDRIIPASSFMLMGQRFVIDSYVTGHVVFDEVVPTPEHPIPRILPSTLDVLFSLGNGAAGQFLDEELERYGYARYLAALRYLIDGYGESFWAATIYNGWLDAIRSLRPPRDRAHLPPFMQTAAWWQQKMNSQLAAWAQLRHDNLLYAKQSGIRPVCTSPVLSNTHVQVLSKPGSRFHRVRRTPGFTKK